MAERNPEVEALIAIYGEATVEAAFAIAQNIGREGIRGIDFSGAAAASMRQSAHGIVQREVVTNIQQRLK